MSLRPFFRWADTTAIAEAIRDSRFVFPILESIHLLALTVLLGTVVVLSLRLLGAGLRSQSVYTVGQRLSPFTLWSLLTMGLTGALLFCSEAMKCYENPPFWAKMEMLAVAVLFHYTFVRSTVRAESAGRMRNAAAAVGSLVLWFGVGAAGRAIGFY
jgi:hypothetical protein